MIYPKVLSMICPTQGAPLGSYSTPPASHWEGFPFQAKGLALGFSVTRWRSSSRYRRGIILFLQIVFANFPCHILNVVCLPVHHSGIVFKILIVMQSRNQQHIIHFFNKPFAVVSHQCSCAAEAPREPQQAAAEVAVEEKSEPQAEKPEVSGQEVRAEVEAVLRQLPACTSREAADEVALAFCYVNSKGARRRLVNTLPLTWWP